MTPKARKNKRLVGLFLLGSVVFNYSLLSLFNLKTSIFGVPLLIFFIFAAWFFLILLAAMAAFVSEGQLADVFTPGLYMLETNNMPILTTLQHWDHGFRSPFKSEIYFVNTTRFTDLKWGTKNPVILRDPEFGPTRIRAFGTYAVRVTDPALFLRDYWQRKALLTSVRGAFDSPLGAEELAGRAPEREGALVHPDQLVALAFEQLGDESQQLVLGEVEQGRGGADHHHVLGAAVTGRAGEVGGVHEYGLVDGRQAVEQGLLADDPGLPPQVSCQAVPLVQATVGAGRARRTGQDSQRVRSRPCGLSRLPWRGGLLPRR